MAIKRLDFTRTTLDPVTQELAIALADGEPVEFNELFTKVDEALKQRNVKTGTEEVLRLRCYNRLLTLAGNGLVEKKEKMFRGLPGIVQAFQNGNAASLKQSRRFC